MNKTQSFEQFLSTHTAQVSPLSFLVNLALAIAVATVLGWSYVRFGTSLSNRRSFARNFVLLTATTTLIIAIVKSSLALSLGLVGALSIVRFRAAIKEPEELAYLFLSIAVGLGFGAGQTEVTLVGFSAILGVLWLSSRWSRRRGDDRQNLWLSVSREGQGTPDLNQILEVLKSNCSALSLRRFDESNEHLEARFLVDFDGFPRVETIRRELRKLDDSLRFTLLDSTGIE